MSGDGCPDEGPCSGCANCGEAVASSEFDWHEATVSGRRIRVGTRLGNVLVGEVMGFMRWTSTPSTIFATFKELEVHIRGIGPEGLRDYRCQPVWVEDLGIKAALGVNDE